MSDETLTSEEVRLQLIMIARWIDECGGLEKAKLKLDEWYMFGKAMMEQGKYEAERSKRIASLPAHNAKTDPFNEECPFEDGQFVRLTQPLPNQGDNDHGIVVGDTGVIGVGFAGTKCVYFDKAPEWGLMSQNEIWITDLCEAINN